MRIAFASGGTGGQVKASAMFFKPFLKGFCRVQGAHYPAGGEDPVTGRAIAMKGSVEVKSG